MTDAKVYKCDATECGFNYGQTCWAAQVELNEKHECITFRVVPDDELIEEKRDE